MLPRYLLLSCTCSLWLTLRLCSTRLNCFTIRLRLCVCYASVTKTTLWTITNYLIICTWRPTPVGTALRFLHFKGTHQFTAPCFIFHDGIQEGIWLNFFQHVGQRASSTRIFLGSRGGCISEGRAGWQVISGSNPCSPGLNWAACRSVLEQDTERQIAPDVQFPSVQSPAMNWRLVQSVPC